MTLRKPNLWTCTRLYCGRKNWQWWCSFWLDPTTI